MARSRNIKPGLFKNEILGVADPLHTLAFQGLWLLADRDGRLEDRPLRIKAETFPYRDGLDIDRILNWLEAERFIIRYEVSGKRYIQVLNFAKHQNPHKNEIPSEIPPPEQSEGVPKKSVHVPSESEALGLIPDSLNLIPDSPFPITRFRCWRIGSRQQFAADMPAQGNRCNLQRDASHPVATSYVGGKQADKPCSTLALGTG